MELLTDELKGCLPAIGSDPDTPMAKTRVHLRYFDPSSSWEWYVLEYDGDQTFFGLALTNHLAVAGQFTLEELQSITGPGGDGVSRDPAFESVTVEELAESRPVLHELLAEPAPREVNAARDLVSLEGAD